MKYMKHVLFVLIALGFVLPSLAFSADWECALKVRSGRAENKLSFGMNGLATDGFDGQFDVPPFTSGGMQASWFGGGKKLWRDIRAEGTTQNWGLSVDSKQAGETVLISWNRSQLPAGTVMLEDTKNGTVVDMLSQSSYSYVNDGVRQLTIAIAQ